MIATEDLVILMLLIPVCYIVISAFKGVVTVKIYQHGVLISILVGLLITLVTDPHPHVPSFVIVLLMPLYSLAVTAITVSIRYFYRMLSK